MVTIQAAGMLMRPSDDPSNVDCLRHHSRLDGTHLIIMADWELDIIILLVREHQQLRLLEPKPQLRWLNFLVTWTAVFGLLKIQSVTLQLILLAFQANWLARITSKLRVALEMSLIRAVTLIWVWLIRVLTSSTLNHHPAHLIMITVFPVSAVWALSTNSFSML